MATRMRTPRPATRTASAAGPVPPTRLFVCAECSHAWLFVVQPRVVCTCVGAPLEGHVLYAGQTGCAQMAPRRDVDVVLAWTAPGAKVTDSRFRRKALRPEPSPTEAAAVVDNAPALAADHRTA